tara:strand:- start:4103 stop:4363 length:261 start_codon:yes stop_codon:yes gene_type:complete
MSKTQQPTNSSILDAHPGPLSFVVGDWDDAKTFYAAVPINGNKLAIIHQANVIKICRTAQSARNFISKHQKMRKKIISYPQTGPLV